MNSDYKKLFIAICEAMEVTAERAMEENKKRNKLKEYKDAKETRSNFARIHDLLISKKIDYIPTKKDFTTIGIGAVLVAKQIEKEVKEKQLVLDGYKQDLLPKLQEIIKCKDDNEIKEKVDEVFKTNN